MKRASLLNLFLAVMVSSTIHAQTLKEVLNAKEKPVTYLGVHFTQARVMGETATDAKGITMHTTLWTY